ncbi:MAG: arsenate reductase (glutaredoxin) [Bdellovibrionales bacterium]|nr:arsenate reductase (glutaredoxin) [Bdellovibrionales bacterium]
MKVSIYHNPRCSKSRQTLALLEEKNLDIKVIEYLKNPPSIQDLKSLSKKLSLKPSEFVRKKESIIKELSLSMDSEEEILRNMANHPILIERPIVVHSQKAIIGRPPEKVLELF